MKRRNLITGLGGATLMAPVVARAQQKPMRVIGSLNPGTSSVPMAVKKPYLDALRQGLSESGSVLGQNVEIEWRFSEGQYDRLPALAAQLVNHNVDVIETNTLMGARAAKNATSTIPIVFNAVPNPVEAGLIVSLARPGGNITGVTNFSSQQAPKFFDLLSELVPRATTVGLLVNPDAPTAEFFVRDVGETARAKGITLSVREARTENEIDASFRSFVEGKTHTLIVVADLFFLNNLDEFVALTLRHAIPTIYYNVQYPRAGGLISYGVDEAAGFGRAFAYVGRILNGANTAEMPVERPTKFILVVNLKAAKALGLTVPQSILAQATEVIE